MIDFGTTRPFKKDTYKTTTVSFKRGYAAEEQYREKGEQGPWTDVYAVCATMYFLLTGNTPLESVQRSIKDTLPFQSEQQVSSLSPRFRKALAKGMAVSYEKRYQSIEALYQDLYCEGNDNTSSTAFSENPALTGRKKVLFSFICACLLFGGGLLCGYALTGWQNGKSSLTAAPKITTAPSNAPVSPIPSASSAIPTESTMNTETPAPSPDKTAAPAEKTTKKPLKTKELTKKPRKTKEPTQKPRKTASPTKKPETNKKPSDKKDSPDFDATLPY